MTTNNILYIGNFTKNHTASQAMIYSIIHQTIPSYLTSVFGNPMTKDMFYNYFIEHSSQLNFITSDSIKDITNNSLHKYEWYCFLSNDCMYNKQYTQELISTITKHNNQEYIILPQNSNNVDYATILINRSQIMQYTQQNLDLDTTRTICIKNSEIKSLKSFQTAILNYEINNDNVLYEDSQSLFGKFIDTDGLLDSMVYINKNNHRVYNISNNIIGYMTEKNGDILRIEWHTNNPENPTLSTTYIIDHFEKYYRAF